MTSTLSTQTTVTLDQLAARLGGALVRPGDDRYPALATPWNVAIPSNPEAIVEAQDASDVAATVRFAAEHGFEVAVRSTGHGALPTDRATLMVHTGRMKALSITGRLARCGAGVRWSDVLEAAAPLGLAPMAGSAPHVGVVGYLTGGGIGPISRTFGVASDFVRALDVVTGDGEIRRATATENPSLFWALRGGKGTVGIVTAVEFELMEVSEIYGGCYFFAAAHIDTVVHAWATWSAGLPDAATTSIAVMRMPALPHIPPPLAGKVSVAVRFAWVGNAEDGAAAFAPLLDAATPVLGGMGTMPASAMGAISNDPVDPMPVAETSTLLSALPADAVDALLGHVGPDAQSPHVVVELRLLGGALAHEPDCPSAFVHRDAAYCFFAVAPAVPPLADAIAAHRGALLAALSPWSTGSCWPNFAGSVDPQEVMRKYDRDTLARLASLATTYDPAGVVAAAAPVLQACLLAG